MVVCMMGEHSSLDAKPAMQCPSNVVDYIAQCKAHFAECTGPPTRGLSGRLTLRTQMHGASSIVSKGIGPARDSCRATEAMLKLLHLWRQEVEAALGYTASAQAVAAVKSCRARRQGPGTPAASAACMNVDSCISTRVLQKC